MAEMPPVFSALLMEFYPKSHRRCSTQKISAANNDCQIQTLWLFWFITITSTTLPFRWAKKWSTENPCTKSFIAAVSKGQGVPLGILMFLPSLPGMVKAELPGTHLGWLVLPIQILPNSPSSLMENYWAFLYCCCCPIALMVMLSNWISPALLWQNTQNWENNSGLIPVGQSKFSKLFCPHFCVNT